MEQRLEVLQGLTALLEASHFARADDLPALVRRGGEALGAKQAVLYLIDYDQVQLIPLIDRQHAALEPMLVMPQTLPVEGTLAGRAFGDVAVQVSGGSSGSTGATVWAPVVDGTDRLGVLEITFDAAPGPDSDVYTDVRTLAAIIAQLTMSRSLIGDSIEITRRRLPMTLEAELQWKLLPPLTFASARVAIAGVLAPTNEVAGDSFDYAVNGDVAHLGIVDAIGHGLESALMSAVAIGALRNARRAGLDLLDTARSIDRQLAAQFGEMKFVTAIIGQLDLVTGMWRWITAGHPPGLLVRSGRVVKVLDTVIDPPLGLRWGEPTMGEERLERGDRILLYTDGVIEARDEQGEFFGTHRLVDFVCREAAAGRPLAETMRRLNLAILAHQEGMLQDDATTLMLEWRADGMQRTVDM